MANQMKPFQGDRFEEPALVDPNTKTEEKLDPVQEAYRKLTSNYIIFLDHLFVVGVALFMISKYEEDSDDAEAYWRNLGLNITRLPEANGIRDFLITPLSSQEGFTEEEAQEKDFSEKIKRKGNELKVSLVNYLKITKEVKKDNLSRCLEGTAISEEFDIQTQNYLKDVRRRLVIGGFLSAIGLGSTDNLDKVKLEARKRIYELVNVEMFTMLKNKEKFLRAIDKIIKIPGWQFSFFDYLGYIAFLDVASRDFGLLQSWLSSHNLNADCLIDGFSDLNDKLIGRVSERQ